ncbi:MAG: DNA-binding transcriptional regulator [Lentisphaeria bacterium]|nr:DNA-binding transcriptional regulator [Lentisphaeria bacterium]
MPAPKRNPKRIAVATTVLSQYEADIVYGVIRYSQLFGHWRFIGTRNRPHISFEDIDLNQVDGVIGGFYDQTWVEAVRDAGIPAVNTSNSMADVSLPRVGTDDLAIGRMGAEHLLECGYPQFGFVMRGDNWYSHRRLAGFREAVEAKAGRPCHILMPPPGLHEDAIEPIPEWLSRLPKPIGIMAANDMRGRQVIDCAVDAGFRVPEDVGVLGVDNDEMASALAATTLSSLKLNGIEAGYRAAGMLDALMAGKSPEFPVWLPPVGVVVRHSSDITVTFDDLVSRAMRYIHTYCQEPITVEDVLSHVRVSRTTLGVRMKRAVGKTPLAAIAHARVERAKKMLADSNATISEIAFECGFIRQEQLSVVFKRQTGMTPSEFRRQR